MNKLAVPALLILGLAGCSQPQHAVSGRRVSLAKGSISFILPDSSFTYSKPVLWPSDYSGGDYGETGAFYHNRDSSVIVSVYVKTFPDSLRRTAPWQMIADEKRSKQEFTERNRGLITIERYAADSAACTVDIDYHVPKRAKKGRRGQASFEKSFTVYGSQRTIEFWVFCTG